MNTVRKHFRFFIVSTLCFGTALVIMLTTVPHESFTKASTSSVENIAYSIQDVVIQPRAVNAAGAVAGYHYFEATKQFHAAVYANGAVKDLGTLPGGTSSSAEAINASGQVVGSSDRGDGLVHAFLYANGVMTDLGALPGGATSYATGINDNGQIVGYSDTREPGTSWPQPEHAFSYTNGKMTDLGNLGSSFAVWSRANAINAAGQIVGYSLTDDGDRRAFLYSGGHMIDLGTLGGSESVALGINSLGHVVGWSGLINDTASRAFIYTGGILVDMGSPDSGFKTARSINSSDAAVGATPNSGDGPAFIYTPATGVRDLNLLIDSSKYFLKDAYGINDAGMIIASGRYADLHSGNFLLTPTGVSTPTPTPTPNRIDDPETFVRQHYVDFLNRSPDADGFLFWSREITACGTDAACIDLKRVNVSAAFFVSIEFQQTGYLVYRIYKVAYGNINGAPVPIRFSEFMADGQQIAQGVIVGQAGWTTVLQNNKQTFLAQFVQTARFSDRFPVSMSPAQFVDKLFSNAGVMPATTERNTALAEFGSATTSADVSARARVLRDVAENATLDRQEFNRAFVLMQYFGYLRRNPNDSPDADFSGYQYWLDKLNSFGGDYVRSEMVRSFLLAQEYRKRF
jgi:probable HAF family extracellular repeat protein